MMPIRLAVVGTGKIARDQHLPAIARSRDFALVATVSPDGAGVAGVAHFQSLDALIAEDLSVDAVALCTPPQVRSALAFQALNQGWHVLLEKPPAATLSEITALECQAQSNGATLFAAWHSRFSGGVAPAKAWLSTRRIDSVSVVWREDVRVWHPGQAWIWQPGGLGVFDPGINALSIVTDILPNLVYLTSATISTPANRAAPIAAKLMLRDTGGAQITMDLDWRQTGPQSWNIVVETDGGTLHLASGGAVLTLPSGTTQAQDKEYPNLYTHFASLIRGKNSEVDIAPLKLVADVFLLGRRTIVENFDD